MRFDLHGGDIDEDLRPYTYWSPLGTDARVDSILLLVSGARTVSARESGIQFSPDDKRVFVSKDVGGQRFAITLNTDDGTVTGNVFSPEGGEPKFIFCEPRPPVVNRFTCAVADAGSLVLLLRMLARRRDWQTQIALALFAVAVVTWWQRRAVVKPWALADPNPIKEPSVSRERPTNARQSPRPRQN